jgi:creatinine amidohydrolase
VTRLLADLTSPEAGRAGAETVLAVPVGATEQHGPHLPLSTDTDIAIALALALGAQRGNVVVAPAVAYGSSGEHAGFPGTLSIGREATELLLVELGRSASARFARILLISGHGGNHGPLKRARRRLRAEGRDVRTFFPAGLSDAHAGRAETSLMLALAASRVRLERAEAGATDPLSELLPRLISAGVREVSANGVLGDPAGASPEEGRALLDRGVGELVALVDGWGKASEDARLLSQPSPR